MKDSKVVHVSGKRKRAIGRATLYSGSGIIKINNRLLDNYAQKIYKMKITEPLILAGDISNSVDIDIILAGGGIASQAEVSRLVIAKALVEYTQDEKLKQTFLDYDRNLLVADVRRNEPAKPNRHGKARAKRQKSYR